MKSPQDCGLYREQQRARPTHHVSLCMLCMLTVIPYISATISGSPQWFRCRMMYPFFIRGVMPASLRYLWVEIYVSSRHLSTAPETVRLHIFGVVLSRRVSRCYIIASSPLCGTTLGVCYHRLPPAYYRKIGTSSVRSL